jgi:hypothetical protein
MMSPYKLAKFTVIIFALMFTAKTIHAQSVFPELEKLGEPVVGYVTVHPVTRIDDCDLNFKQGTKLISSPDWFKTETWGGHFSCKERQILSRLAYLESTYRKDVCNARLKQYCGLFQIGNAARKECINNGKNTSDYHCALYHFRVNPNRFEAYSRNKFLFNI